MTVSQPSAVEIGLMSGRAGYVPRANDRGDFTVASPALDFLAARRPAQRRPVRWLASEPAPDHPRPARRPASTSGGRSPDQARPRDQPPDGGR